MTLQEFLCTAKIQIIIYYNQVLNDWMAHFTTDERTGKFYYVESKPPGVIIGICGHSSNPDGAIRDLIDRLHNEGQGTYIKIEGKNESRILIPESLVY